MHERKNIWTSWESNPGPLAWQGTSAKNFQFHRQIFFLQVRAQRGGARQEAQHLGPSRHAGHGWRAFRHSKGLFRNPRILRRRLVRIPDGALKKRQIHFKGCQHRLC